MSKKFGITSQIQKITIERITITGPQDDAESAFKFCQNNGYHITCCGPKPLGGIKVDPDAFIIVAEREIE